jgi:4-hydroxy-4-methyl-2-oxoglutarate aldolase
MNLRSLLARLCEYDTALLANTIGYIDPTPPELFYMGRTIRCLTPELVPVAGVAFTAEIDTSTPGQKSDTGLYWSQMEEMQQAGVPVLWVVQTAGSRPDHECVLGDGMAKTLFSCGCIGVVTDGGVRDVAGMRSVPFAVYSNGITIHHAALRVLSTGKPVEVGGLTVNQGDILHGNSEGVIRIPHACLESLPERARAMHSFEREAHEALRDPTVPLANKKRRVGELLAAYGFA